MAGRKKRNGGCGCGGMCGNPKCRNPSGSKQRARGVRGYDDFSGAGDSAALAWAAQTRREMAAAKRGRYGDLDVYRRSHAGDIAASSRHRPLRNPSVHTGSEDYRIGLFQGAIEKGKIPPPHNTSADLRRGYADGAKVAKAKPTMVAEALGVYKATGNQQQAGAVLYNEVKGESVATLRNPSLAARRNPSYDETERMRKIKKMAAKGEVKDWILTDREGTWERDIRKLIRQTQEDPAFVAKIKDMGLTEAKVNEQIAFKIRLDALHAMLNYAKKTRPKRNPSLNVRNPMSAAARKHLAHEKGEEKAFASMMAALAEGVTVKVGAHRVRKLSKGYVVVDGERLTTTQAAAKLHRGK